MASDNRKRESILETSYWLDVNGEKFSIWKLLKFANYKSAESFRFDVFGEEKWLKTPRTTRQRYRRFVEDFLRSKPASELVKIQASLSLQTRPDQLDAGAAVGTVHQHLPRASSATDDDDKNLQSSCTVHVFDDIVEDEEEQDSPPFSDTRLPPACVYEFSDEHRVPVLDRSGALNKDGSGSLLPKNRRKLLVSELFDSFVIENNISQEKANQFIRDIQVEDAVMDLHTVPVTFRNRAKLPKQKKSSTLTGTYEVNNGKYHHFGLFEQVKKHFSRVVQATFPDESSRPKAPTICIDAWTDGTSVAETGSKIHVYPVAIHFIAIGVWDEDVFCRKFVSVPDKLSFMPLPVGVFVGTGEPEHPEVILRRFVYELIMLDPRERDDRQLFQHSEAIGSVWKKRRETMFTINLLWFLADTPARRLCKHTRAWNLASDGGCEACTAVGIKFNNRMATSRYEMSEAGLELRIDSKFLSYTSHLNTVSAISIQNCDGCLYCSRILRRIVLIQRCEFLKNNQIISSA